MKTAQPTKNCERCDECLFGRAVTITVKTGKGKDATEEAVPMCECHVARPTRYGFPTVRPDDFCSYHVDADTRERSFADFSPNNPIL